MKKNAEFSLSSRLRLRMALFVCGAVVMALEILGTRIIGPHFGVGLFVWTSLITVTLVALALGYWLGGVLADRRPSIQIFSVVLLAAAAAIIFILPIRELVLKAAWMLGLRAGSFAAATVLFMPPLLLLGMASPFAVRLETEGLSQVGRSAGRLYAISTAGSVLGALLTGFLLVPCFRVPVVLEMLSGGLALAAVLVAAPEWRVKTVAAALALILGAQGFDWPRTQPVGLIEMRTCAGTDLRVVDDKGSRMLFVDQIIQTSINDQGRSEDKYIYFLASRLLMARPKAKSVAMVGLGGGGIVPLLTQQGLEVEGVDLSREVLELARTRFGLNLPPARLHSQDGRVFLKQHPAHFDSVILDVFTGDRLAFSLVSVEGLRTAKAALKEGGLLAMNTWGIDLDKGGPNQVGAAIRATLLQVFQHVLAVPASGNLLFFASDQPITPGRTSVELVAFDGPQIFNWVEIPPTTWPEASVLTDDWNPVDVMDTAALEAMRAERRTQFSKGVEAALAWE